MEPEYNKIIKEVAEISGYDYDDVRGVIMEHYSKLLSDLYTTDIYKRIPIWHYTYLTPNPCRIKMFLVWLIRLNRKSWKLDNIVNHIKIFSWNLYKAINRGIILKNSFTKLRKCYMFNMLIDYRYKPDTKRHYANKLYMYRQNAIYQSGMINKQGAKLIRYSYDKDILQ